MFVISVTFGCVAPESPIDVRTLEICGYGSGESLSTGGCQFTGETVFWDWLWFVSQLNLSSRYLNK